MEGVRHRSSFLMRLLLTLMVPDLIHSLGHPVFMSKRFGKHGSSQLPALIPMSVHGAQRIGEFKIPDYEDNYDPLARAEETEGYPLAPVYGYVNEQPEGEPAFDVERDRSEDSNYPYGQETWFEGGDKDDSVAFLRNLIFSQMDRDPDENEVETVPYVYGKSVEFSPDDYDDESDRTWSYGIPVLEERDEAEIENDESVKELESLRKHLKAEEAMESKIKHEKQIPFAEEEMFHNHHLQKQINRSSRKNHVPIGFKVNEKRFYPGEKPSPKASVRQSHHVKAKDSNVNAKPEAATTAKPPQTQTGQKEYVLPRPANPVRKPAERGIRIRSTEKANVYDTIKKLLAMEEGLEKANTARIQKRFVLSEDQLTSQLSGLKKTIV